MAELVPFAVPTGSDKTLLVWALSAGPTAEALQHSLFTVFSQFGLLYSVRVFPNAAVASPGFSAIIKFYSAREAQRAQKACDGKLLFQASPVKVRLGTRHKAVLHHTLPLASSRCQELANYYFGFQGWSKRIIKKSWLQFNLRTELWNIPGMAWNAVFTPDRYRNDTSATYNS
ncbi:RAD52 motif-containing protein 1-like isoform X3 [Perognathus longimembris pacificus]|uniref:RAD52 motif-containing protein 1-like isoform X3 n=1 Tax=Perognathus longimembris pacificus TaxID=214514 RepID=UPI0020195B83|nr:RAD52 motif-containing protein 1-like isoform X3 [Perognathus longimembris pacificus]